VSLAVRARHETGGDAVDSRIAALDREGLTAALDAQGYAVLPSLLSPDDCAELAARYDDAALFRSRVVMARHGYGQGEYQYFGYPLPLLIAALRSALYPLLAPLANRWNERMGIDVRYPPDHPAFLARSTAPGKSGRPRCCCAIARAITIACIRISMASMCFRSRRPYCCRSRAAISPVASSSWSSSALACNRAPTWCRLRKATRWCSP
jgi:hypothetical protein